MATIRDVASLAGVSAAAVSLYINGKAAGRVSPQKQKQIEEAIGKLDYRPNAGTRAQISPVPAASVHTIAVYWASDARSALLGKVLNGIQNSLERNRMVNLNIVICPYRVNELYKEKSLVEPELYNYSAAIIANTATMDMQYLDSICPTIPVVLLNRQLPQYSYAAIDNEQMGDSLAALIAERGFQRVSVFRTTSPFLAMTERVSGFIGGCRSRQLELPNQALFYTDNSVDGGIEAANRFLELGDRPGVIFCDSDSIALGALYRFHEAGIRIPQDLSMVSVGLHHSSATSCSIPPLTVAEVPLQQMAEACTDCVAEILGGKTAGPVHKKIETFVTLRKSLAQAGSQKK